MERSRRRVREKEGERGGGRERIVLFSSGISEP